MPRLKRDKDGIYWRNGWAYLQYRGKYALKTQDRETARRLARDIKTRIDNPAHAAAHVTSLGQACEEFRAHAATGENRRKPPSPETFAMYETHFGNLCRVLGLQLPLDELDASAVDRYIATRRAERIGKAPGAHLTGRRPDPTKGQPDARRMVSASTVDKELGTLRQILRLGLRRGWYHLPLEKVVPETAGGVYEPGDRHLTLEQVPKLLEALAAGQYDGADGGEGRAATCAYIIATGADWCAVERAERDDLGGVAACALLVLIRGTKNRERWAEVGIYAALGEFADRARRWLAAHGTFPKWGKQRCRDLRVACERAGVPRVTVRDLRRTHGKILAALGVDPHLIGSQLRHRDSRMAERVYARRERADVRQQVARVTRLAAG